MNEWTCEDLRSRLEAGQPVSVVDIREADDHESWNILGSRNVAVYDALRRDHVEPLIDRSADLRRDAPIVAVCHAGVVSRKAAAVLRSLGFDAVSLRGGMREWSGAWSAARIDEHLAPGVTLLQIRRLGKGCLSYLVGARGEAAVVDPCVDVEVYRDLAAREALRITHVVETHVHADHLSRARALCEATGATLVLPPNDRVRFPFAPLADGQMLRFGGLAIEALATPGHTGESTSYRIGEAILLTGDTVFVDSVGRPDLERGAAGAEAGARALHRSLRRIFDLGDETWIYPGHHGCPIPFDRRPVGARLGDLRERLAALPADESAFAARIVARLGEKPPNFEMILAVNEGRGDLGDDEPLDVEAGPNRCAAG